MSKDYIPLATDIMNFGNRIESRYGPCIELIGGRFECPSGLLLQRNGINYALGWMEMLQLIGGVFDFEAINRVAPLANHELFTWTMAYGPRLRDQVPAVLEAIRDNPDTRQAVLHVAKPEDGPTSDKPCTLDIQFLVRAGTIHATVSMRSWDICRGLPYDIMMFSGLLEVFAACLDLVSGNVIVNAGSAHIYEDQMHRIPWVADRSWTFVDPPDTWKDFVEWAHENIETLQKGGVPSCIEYQ